MIPTIVHRAKLQLPIHPALLSSFLEVLECQVIILQNKMSNGKKARKTDTLGSTEAFSVRTKYIYSQKTVLKGPSYDFKKIAINASGYRGVRVSESINTNRIPE